MTTETAPVTSVEHGTFTLERTFPHDRATVFAAWATADAKRGWYGEEIDFLSTMTRYELDFRVGGLEVLEGTLASGRAFALDSIYRDIVDGRRIVAVYDVRIDDRRISSSLLTVQFLDATGGCTMVVTEQGAFLDGFDTNAERTKGAAAELERLGAYLAS
jgi:uncharacterized protein YndB with AHSA1/START domain